MDLRLSEEEKLIQATAAQFVDKELLAREGAFLKQSEPFLPPGAPARRELSTDARLELTARARRRWVYGIWNCRKCWAVQS